MDVEVLSLPVMDRRESTFQQPLLAKLREEVPPVLCRGVALEGVKIHKQRKRWLDFDYVAKGEEPYQKPKGIRHD